MTGQEGKRGGRPKRVSDETIKTAYYADLTRSQKAMAREVGLSELQLRKRLRALGLPSRPYRRPIVSDDEIKQGLNQGKSYSKIGQGEATSERRSVTRQAIHDRIRRWQG